MSALTYGFVGRTAAGDDGRGVAVLASHAVEGESLAALDQTALEVFAMNSQVGSDGAGPGLSHRHTQYTHLPVHTVHIILTARRALRVIRCGAEGQDGATK